VDVVMPLICKFSGVKVYMYYQDHLPPHIHLRGTDFKAVVSLPDGKLLAGLLPRGVKATVTAWIKSEAKALMENWRRAQAGEPLSRVNPPEKGV